MKQDWLVSSLTFIRLNLGILLVSLGLFVVLVWGGTTYWSMRETASISTQEVQEQISATATVVPTTAPEIIAAVAITPTPAATSAAVQVAPTPTVATAAAKPKPTSAPTVKPTPSPTPKPILTQLPVASPTPLATPSARPTIRPTATPSAAIKPIVRATATPSAEVAVKTSPTPRPTAIPQPITPSMTKGGLPVDGGLQAPATGSAKAGTYTVVKGDSTWKVAQKFYGSGYKYVEIEKANKLKHNQHLRIGQVLVLLESSASTTVKSDALKEDLKAAPVVKDAKTGTGETKYVVKAGDSLWSIAGTQLGNSYRWSELYTANKQTVGRNPHLIYPGQTLVLPRSTTSPNIGK